MQVASYLATNIFGKGEVLVTSPFCRMFKTMHVDRNSQFQMSKSDENQSYGTKQQYRIIEYTNGKEPKNAIITL